MLLKTTHKKSQPGGMAFSLGVSVVGIFKEQRVIYWAVAYNAGKASPLLRPSEIWQWHPPLK